MARVGFASLALVTLKIRSDRSRHRENDLLAEKDAPPFAKALLHHRRAAAMADDERAALPHRICKRQVNPSRIGETARSNSNRAALRFLFLLFFFMHEMGTRNLSEC